MKLLVFKVKCILGIFLLITSCNQKIENSDIIGEWSDEKQKISINFLKNNEFKGNVNGQFLSSFNSIKVVSISGNYIVINDSSISFLPKIELNVTSVNNFKSDYKIELFFYKHKGVPILSNHEDSFLYCELSPRSPKSTKNKSF